ncbi:MAG: hypothetical protein ACI8S6_004863 [Myxococcota bacterium]
MMTAIEQLPPMAELDISSALAKSALHLDAQCECVPERRAEVSGCAGAPDCETFARCAVTLTRDGWRPR